MRTRIVITIDHENLPKIDAEIISEVFYEAGDIDWKVTVESVTDEDAA